MRLAVWHDPPLGGARRAFDELLLRVARRHSVDIFQLTRPGESPLRPAYAHALWPMEYQPHDQRRNAPYWNDWQTLLDLRRLEAVERTLAARIDSAGFDAVVTSVLGTAVAPALPRFLHVANAYFCHEPPRRFYEPKCRPDAAPLTAYERARRIWRLPAQTYLDARSKRSDVTSVRAASCVITNSSYTAQRVKQIYARHAHVCYLGVDHERFRPAHVAAPPTRVLSVGSLEPHKGFDFLIRAIGLVHERRRPALTIVGRGGHPRMPTVLQQLASRLQVNLEVRSNVAENERADVYRAHAVFVFAAHYEPFGLVVLEALASGLPVVAVGEGGPGESVRHGETGWLVRRDEAQFAAAVEELVSNPRQRVAMSEAARSDVVCNWDWDTSADRFENLLERELFN
jgi:glycosyltransferase involved in cell wall biosynthesis